MLTDVVLRFFTSHRLVEPGDVLLAAVSGGPDSSALLHLVHDAAVTLGASVEAAHLDHGLRGEESREDARFVRELTETLGVTLHHRAVDVAAVQARSKGSLEAIARAERYAFLEEAAARAGARWIVTGHCADDQVETLLLNLLRGAGVRGLGGMLPVGPGNVCRPLLETWKLEILEFLEDHDLVYRLDPTNLDLGPTRNRVRHLLVPLLRKEFSDAAPQILARSTRLFAEVDDYLVGEAERVLEDEVLTGENGAAGLRLDAAVLLRQHPALQREIVRAALHRVLGGLEEIASGHVDAILGLAAAESPSGRLDLPRGAEARREYGILLLGVAGELVPGDEPPPDPVVLDLGHTGETRGGPWRLQWTVGAVRAVWDAEATTRDPLWAAFDLEALHPPVRLRSVLPGDRLEPAGMDGSQKVSDLLINRKVPRVERSRIGILCDNGGPGGGERILWVVGQRVARHAPAGSPSSQVVVFQAEPAS